ncbi:MAG TPA: ABC transporter ATP-binding protein [Stellaceae bacterium]|nr:ABC transporter ATP-binding protein [Stellaceae bacterium]
MRLASTLAKSMGIPGGAVPFRDHSEPWSDRVRPAAGATGAQRRWQPPGAASFPLHPLRFLWHFVRRRPFVHFAAIASVAGAAAAACGSQYGLKMIVDAMAGGPANFAGVWQAAAVFAGLLACESALWRIGGTAGCRAIVADKAEAKLELFDHLTGHSGRFFSERLGGALADRVAATGEAVQQIFQSGLFNIVPVCADFCAAMVLIATVEWQLMAALSFFVISGGVGLCWLSRRGNDRHDFYADRAARVAGELADVVSNIWVVKAFAARSRERRRFAGLLTAEADAHRSSRLYIERLRGLHDAGLWLVSGGMLVWSIELWAQGRVTAGDVILTLAMAFRILHGSRDLAFALVNSSQFVARIAESIRVIGETHDVADPPTAETLLRLGGSIEFAGVGFSYPEGSRVFRGLDLHIPPGQRVGLVGPSGAGKSTLIALVQRLYDVDNGRLLIDGQDIRGMTQDSLRAAIAVVPQDVSLFHRTVLENIRYGRPDADDEAVMAAARAARCEDFIKALPQGGATIVGERGAKLSGGQRQRIGIARALLRDAPIILLDEATSALDSEAEIEVHRALETLMRGRTVLAIAHRTSTLANFDRVIVLRDGRIVEDGSPAELRRRGDAFDRVCRLQEPRSLALR